MAQGDKHAQSEGAAYGDSAPTMRAVRLAAPYTHVDGHCWRASLPLDLAGESDETDNVERSPWRLLENGHAIGMPHTVHSRICAEGGGSYSHWHQTLYFSTSDNSDPNTNGRPYELRAFADFSAIRSSLASASPLEWIPPRIVAPAVRQAVGRLADILHARNVREVVYFHTDHFEPWAGTADQQWRALDRFAELTRRSIFGRRLSLFLTPPVWFSLADPNKPTGYRSCEGDQVVFWERSPELIDKCRDGLRPLEADIGHEFHIHIHHENWTRTARSDTNYDVAEWVNAHSDAESDLRRLDLFLQMARQVMREDLGRDFDKWAFVHGHWALNGSDSRYCQIENEIALLQRHGCYGDFTFPAPNPHSQPESIDRPYTCLPVTGPKIYDSINSNPRPLTRGSKVIGPERFLIWNSPIGAEHVSLDFYNANNRRLYRDPETLLHTWLERSAVLDGRLYVKTHAHSLHSAYQAWEDDRPIPHSYPDIVLLFELLQRACDKANVPFVPSAVSEVMDNLRAFDQGDDRPVLAKEEQVRETPLEFATSEETGTIASPIVKSPLVESQRIDGWQQSMTDTLDQEIYSFLQEEQDLKGADGLYQWYRYKFVPCKIGLAPYDRQIARFVVANRNVFDQFVEVGAAAAQQSILIAMHHVRCVPIESSAINFDLMARLIARVQARFDADLSRFITPFYDWFPTKASEYVTPRTLLCFPTLSWGLTEQQEQSILESIRQSAGVIIGLRDFFRTRQTEEEREELIDRLRSLGFEAPVDVYAWKDVDYQFPPDRIVYLARTGGPAMEVQSIC